MRPCAKRPLILAAVLGLFAFPAEAQISERLGGLPTVAPGGEGGADALAVTQFTIVGSVALAPLTVEEVLGIPSSAVDAGAWLAGADPAASVTVNTAVLRTAEPIWDAWFTAQADNPRNIDVQLSLTGLDGSPGVLTHVSDPSSRMLATLIATTPVVVERDRRDRLMQGGVQFLLDCSDALLPGQYGGQLLVTVNQF